MKNSMAILDESALGCGCQLKKTGPGKTGDCPPVQFPRRAPLRVNELHHRLPGHRGRSIIAAIGAIARIEQLLLKTLPIPESNVWLTEALAIEARSDFALN